MNHSNLIAITGGIGSGKSVVCRILLTLGYSVYDSDARAKALMDSSGAIKRELVMKIHPEAVDDNGIINRKVISQIVFSDPAKLAALNAIVHQNVRDDLLAWKSGHKGTLFVETAILYQSGLDKLVDEVWQVEAPIDLRIQRVMARNNITAEAVAQRIASQHHTPAHPHPHIHLILNDQQHSILLQLHSLLTNR